MSSFDPFKHHRRSLRLKGYEYAESGAYFVTVCTHNRQAILGEMVDAEMRLNECGQIVAGCWEKIPRHFEHVQLDAFVIMPNHIHGVIVITGDAAMGAKHFCDSKNASPLQPRMPHGTQTNSLGAVLQNFKSVSTRKINYCRDTSGARVWQRNYYEHVIRNESEWNAIRQYVLNNPANWLGDAEYRA